MANSPQTGTQAKESKMHFKNTVKMLQISQCPWAACKLGLQMNSSQQQFLNKGKRPQLKIQTQKQIRYLLHYFGKIFNSPPPGTLMEFGVFQSSKKRTILTNVCLFNSSHGFLRFFTRFFNTKKFAFTARPLAHCTACQSADY